MEYLYKIKYKMILKERLVIKIMIINIISMMLIIIDKYYYHYNFDYYNFRIEYRQKIKNVKSLNALQHKNFD